MLSFICCWATATSCWESCGAREGASVRVVASEGGWESTLGLAGWRTTNKPEGAAKSHGKSGAESSMPGGLYPGAASGTRRRPLVLGGPGGGGGGGVGGGG